MIKKSSELETISEEVNVFVTRPENRLYCVKLALNLLLLVFSIHQESAYL